MNKHVEKIFKYRIPSIIRSLARPPFNEWVLEY